MKQCRSLKPFVALVLVNGVILESVGEIGAWVRCHKKRSKLELDLNVSNGVIDACCRSSSSRYHSYRDRFARWKRGLPGVAFTICSEVGTSGSQRGEYWGSWINAWLCERRTSGSTSGPWISLGQIQWDQGFNRSTIKGDKRFTTKVLANGAPNIFIKQVLYWAQNIHQMVDLINGAQT